VDALAQSGGEVSGLVQLQKDYYVSATRGQLNQNGYVLVASISVQATYQDVPICFEIFRRQVTAPSFLFLSFVNSSEANPPIKQFSYCGTGSPANFGIVQNSNNGYDIYVLKTGANDAISISAVKTKPEFMVATITYPGTQVASMPSDAVNPTYYWPASA